MVSDLTWSLGDLPALHPRAVRATHPAGARESPELRGVRDPLPERARQPP